MIVPTGLEVCDFKDALQSREKFELGDTRLGIYPDGTLRFTLSDEVLNGMKFLRLVTGKIPLSTRHIRLLIRIANGDVPRASRKEFEELRMLPGVGRELQLESSNGADTSAGYVLTDLHGKGAAKKKARAFLNARDGYASR